MIQIMCVKNSTSHSRIVQNAEFQQLKTTVVTIFNANVVLTGATNVELDLSMMEVNATIICQRFITVLLIN